MKYLARTFTLPTSSTKTTGLNWDLAFLTREEFIARYNMTPEEYTAGKGESAVMEQDMDINPQKINPYKG